MDGITKGRLTGKEKLVGFDARLKGRKRKVGEGSFCLTFFFFFFWDREK